VETREGRHTGAPTRTARRPIRLGRAGVGRAAEWLRSSESGLPALALIVGVGAGLGAIAFRYLITGFTLLFTGHLDYTVLGRVPNPHLPALGVWYVAIVPAIGGLIYGPLVERFAHEARGHGVPEVMLAVAEKGGRIRPRVAVVKSLASAICIGSGGSVGREGPIVQIGSALGSTLGQVFDLSESRLRLLVACGAAGGISATFNAPIAGVFFALEVILLNFEARSFGVVVLASVAADVVGRAAFGSYPFLALPSFTLVSGWEYALYGLLGLIAGLVGVTFIRVLYGMEDLLDRLWRAPEWLRPAASGVLLGGVILLLPEMYGVGYPVIHRMIAGQYVGWFLVALLFGKIFATSLTLSGGGSGGVFAPSLFMGAALGSAFGALAHGLFPTATASAGAYGLVGMAAVFSAAARAPITAVLIVFELTGDYRIILPLMFAVAVSTALGHRLSRDSIYTLKLRRRGIEIMASGASSVISRLKVEDAMRPAPAIIPERLPVRDLAARLDDAQTDALPVVDEAGSYRGVIGVGSVSGALRDGRFNATAADLADRPPPLRQRQTLLEALDTLASAEQMGVPVVDDANVVVGWVAQRDVLTLLSRRLNRDVAEARAARRGQPGAMEPAPQPAQLEAPREGYRGVDVELTGHATAVGERLGDIVLPPGALVAAMVREGRAWVPDRDTVLLKGDKLTIILPDDMSDAVVDALVDLRVPKTGETAAPSDAPQGEDQRSSD
jgi:chloride channel protein, CIC family